MLGEIELSENLQPRDDARDVLRREHRLLLHDAVDAKTNMHEALVGDEMHVACAGHCSPPQDLADGPHRGRVGRELPLDAQLLVDERATAPELVQQNGDVVGGCERERHRVAACELELRKDERGDLCDRHLQDAVDEPVRHCAEALEDVERNRADSLGLEGETAELDERDSFALGARACTNRREAISHC